MGFITTTDEHIASGGTITGNLTIDADVTVTGSTAITTNEVIQGTSIIDVGSTEAFLVRKNSDGGDVFIVDSTNTRVGVGNTPVKALHIGDASNNSGNGTIRLQGYSAGGSGNYHDIVSYGDNLALYRNTTLQLHLNYDGKVGIGTTAPSELLTLAHNAADGDGGILIINENTTIGDDVYLGGIGWDSADGNIPSSVGEAGAAIVARSAEAHSTTDKGADLLFLTAPIDQDDDTTTPERMRITSEGNVGIGGTPTTAKLEIHGGAWNTSLLIKGSSSTTGIKFVDSAGNIDGYVYAGGDAVGFLDTGGDWMVEARNDDSIKFSVGASERARIDSSGNLLIGHSASVAQEIDGGGHTPNLQINQEGNGGLSITQWNTSNARTSSPKFWFAKNAGGTVGTHSLVAAGEVLGTMFFSGSDGNDFVNAASIHAIADSSTGSNDMPGALIFSTTPDGDDDVDERMRITSAGLVGLNKSAPTSPLHIYADDNTKYQMVIEQDSASTGDAALKFDLTGSRSWLIGADNSSGDSFKICADANDLTDSTAITIDTNLNVGIGASPVAMHADYSLLQVGSTGTIFSQTASAAGKSMFIGQNVFRHTDGTWDTIVEDEQTLYEQNAGVHWFYSGASHASASSLATIMKIDINSRISLSNNDASGAVGTTLFGYKAGLNIVSGAVHNTFIGHQVADASLTNAADYNTGVGGSALSALTSGYSNVAVGFQALVSNTDGLQNTAIGTSALYYNVGTDNNTALGDQAGMYTTGASNTYVGQSAGRGASGADVSNVGVGMQALKVITSGSENVSIGKDSMYDADTASGVVAVGTESAYNITSGSESVAIGKQALYTATTVGANTAVGYQALKLNAVASNTAVGHSAGLNTTGTLNTYVGATAGTGSAGAETNNTAIGASALAAVTSGSYNTVVGTYAGDAITTSSNCTLIGRAAGGGINHTDADGAVCVGNDSGESNQSGQKMTAIGKGALQANTIGDNNTALGYESLKTNVDGSNNVAIGGYSLYTFEASSAGDGCNTALGANSGYLVSTGQDNVLIGENAGWINSGTSLTTGSGNTLVGYQAAIGAAAGVNRTAIGKGTVAQQNNSVTLGNSSVTAVYMADDSGAKVYCGSIDLDNQTLDISSSYIAANIGTKKTLGTTDASDNITGIKCHTEFEDAEFFGNLTGVDIKAAVNTASSGESLDVIGALIEAEIASYGSTDVNNVYGLKTIADINGGIVDSDVYGNFLDVDIESGCTLSNDVYGFQMNIDSDTNPTGAVTAFYMRLDGNGDKFIDATDVANSTDRFEVLSTGVVNAEGTINASQSMDYAEYFESKDGKEIAVGTTVKLDGNKIVVCSDGDTPLGVIRPKSGNQIVGGGQMFHWESMFMKDDYGANIWEDYTKVQWTEEITFKEYTKRGKDETGGVLGGTVKDSKVEGSKAVKAKDAVLDEDGKELEPAVKAVDAIPDKYYRKHKYHSDRLPDGVTAPKDAKVIKIDKQRQKLNPDYDTSKSYKSREERTEWHIVGLLGQIPITKGQPVASNWIKMKDVSDKVEMYFVK